MTDVFGQGSLCLAFSQIQQEVEEGIQAFPIHQKSLQIEVGVIVDIRIVFIEAMAFMIRPTIRIGTDDFDQTVLGIEHIFRLHLTDGIVNSFHIVIGKHKQGILRFPIGSLLPCIHHIPFHHQPAMGVTFMRPVLVQAESGMIHMVALRIPLHLAYGYLIISIRDGRIPIPHQTTGSVILQIPHMFSVPFQVRYFRETNLFT